MPPRAPRVTGRRRAIARSCGESRAACGLLRTLCSWHSGGGGSHGDELAREEPVLPFVGSGLFACVWRGRWRQSPTSCDRSRRKRGRRWLRRGKPGGDRRRERHRWLGLDGRGLHGWRHGSRRCRDRREGGFFDRWPRHGRRGGGGRGRGRRDFGRCLLELWRKVRCSRRWRWNHRRPWRRRGGVRRCGHGRLGNGWIWHGGRCVLRPGRGVLGDGKLLRELDLHRSRRRSAIVRCKLRHGSGLQQRVLRAPVELGAKRVRPRVQLHNSTPSPRRGHGAGRRPDRGVLDSDSDGARVLFRGGLLHRQRGQHRLVFELVGGVRVQLDHRRRHPDLVHGLL
jgi:hypothetical protein